jgi:hypothetical protein
VCGTIPFGSAEKDVYRTDRHVPYYTEDDSPGLQAMSDILLTHAFYNFDLGV